MEVQVSEVRFTPEGIDVLASVTGEEVPGIAIGRLISISRRDTEFGEEVQRLQEDLEGLVVGVLGSWPRRMAEAKEADRRQREGDGDGPE